MDLTRQDSRLNASCLALPRCLAVPMLLLIASVTLSLTGCGDGKIARYPVEGKVLVNGKPVKEAMVVFCPVGGSEELQKLRPSGKTNAEGDFILTTFENSDGAPAGEYQIMIRWKGNSGPRAPGKQYANPSKSGITATIDPEKTVLEPFSLKIEKSRRR